MSFEVPITPWRVKVYELEHEEWQDRGTGFCSGEIVSSQAFLMVMNEDGRDEMLLTSRIKGDMQYQKQQETLIVWTETNKNDMALSFQEPEGCAMICEFLVYVQQKYEHAITIMATMPSGTGDGDLTEVIAGPITYPPEPKLGNLEEVANCIQTCTSAHFSHEAIVKFINDGDYVAKLVGLFDTAENLESLDDLHHLCRIVKMLLLMNDNAIFETMLKEENVTGVMGILEYDPDFPKLKANHREYLADESKFNEVVPIKAAKIRDRIKQTFLLQFLKDVVLARQLDDATFSMLNSLIYFNQIEIIDYLEKSEEFTTQLFSLYRQPNPLKKQRDGVRFVYQLSIVAKEFPLPQRYPLYMTLVRRGIFDLIRFALADDDYATKLLGAELLVTVIEHDPIASRLKSVGESVDGEERQQPNDEEREQTASEVLISILKKSADLELKTQATESLIMLLDVSNISLIDSPGNFDSTHKSQEEQLHLISKFEQAFYEHCAPILFADLIYMAKQDKIDDSMLSTQSKRAYIEQLCELLSHSIQQKRVVSRQFVITHGLWNAIGMLIRVRHKQVRLAAIGCLKHGLESFDQPHINDMIKYGVFGSVFYVLEQLGNVNNLMHSSCLELLDIVNDGISKAVVRWSIKVLLDHLVSGYRSSLEALDYTSVGPSLLRQHETLLDKVGAAISPLGPSSPLTNDDHSLDLLESGQLNGTVNHEGVREEVIHDEEVYHEAIQPTKLERRIGLKRHQSDEETPSAKRRTSGSSDDFHTSGNGTALREADIMTLTTLTYETITTTETGPGELESAEVAEANEEESGTEMNPIN